MLASPLVTTITRYFGSRPPMLIGVFLLAGGFIGASFASCVWHLYPTQGVLVGLGVGFTYLPSIAILPQWFGRRRSTASAISAAGSGIGGLIFSLATGSIIESLSLPWALRITGIVTGCVNLVAVLLIRDRNHIVNPNHDGLHLGLLRQAEVQWLLSWVFIMLFGYIGIQFSLSDFATSIGIKGMRANLVTAMLNVGTALGRPWIGLLCDRYGRIEVSGFLTLATGILCFGVWLPAQSLGVLLFFVIVEGAIYGVFWAVRIIH
jgi:MFS family permease